ncbi:cutinase transcription factor 1 beta [Fusarium mundagurra]|uniref:Cutinase transcription factor 1 beta n=1 Tax=Fusarium mundagurra TaxID=1567541 RepID=A0A8H5XW76_9HYPO|nr:cutinase transcription factor 1 beta [Fusarium mundagurra]
MKKSSNSDGTSTISEPQNRIGNGDNVSVVFSPKEHRNNISSPRLSPDKPGHRGLASLSSGTEKSGAANYLNPSILSFSSKQPYHISDKSTSLISAIKLDPFIIPLPSSMRTGDISYLMSRGALTLPDLKLRNALLRSFFTHIHPFMPVIDMDEFLGAIRSDGRHLQISFLLFQAVMFAGAACIPMCYLEKLGFASRMDAREELFTRVRLLYDFNYEADRLVLVQSLLLMTLWYKSPEEHRNTWHWIDVAVSQAFAIGLHLEPNKAILSRRQCSLRRKIWWSCYATDRLISLNLRRPPKIRAGDFQVKMPEESDFQINLQSKDRHVLIQAMCPYASDSDSRSTLGRLFIELAGLCRLMDSFLQSYRSPRIDDDDILLSCDYGTSESLNHRLDTIQKLSALKKQLTDWKNSLPQVSHYKSSTSTEFTSTIYLHYTVLHMTFQTLMLYTHRSTSIVAKQDRDYAGAEEAKTGMIDAATKISNLAGDVIERGLCSFLPASILGGLVHATAICLQNARDKDEPRKQDSEEGLMQCLEVITIMEEIYEPAKMAKEAIERASSRPWHLDMPIMDISPDQDMPPDNPGTSYSSNESNSPNEHTGDGPQTDTPSTATSLWPADLEHMEELCPVLMAWGLITKEEPMIASPSPDFCESSTASMEGLGILNDFALSMEFRHMTSDICSIKSFT